MNKISAQWKWKVHHTDHFLHSPRRDATGYKSDFGHNGAAWERTFVHLFDTYSPFTTLKWWRGKSRGLDPDFTWAGSEDQGPNACAWWANGREESMSPPPLLLVLSASPPWMLRGAKSLQSHGKQDIWVTKQSNKCHDKTEGGGEAPARHSWWSRMQLGEGGGLRESYKQAWRSEINLCPGKVRWDLGQTPGFAHTLYNPRSASHQPYFCHLPYAWHPAPKCYTSKLENSKGEQ